MGASAGDDARTSGMNFAFSEEQEELRRITRQFLESKSPESEVRRLMDTDEGYDPAVWSQMANELGLQSLIIPEEYGGQGFTFVELTVVLEEMGRALLCAPYFSSCVLAASALLHSGDDAAKKEHLPGIASGETIATLAFTEPNGKWDESGIEATATKAGDGYKLNGTKMFVLDGAQAGPDHRGRQDRQRRVAVRRRRRAAPASTRTNLSTMDQTRKQAKIEFADAAGARSSAPRAPAGPRSSGCSTSPPSRWPPSRSAAPRRCSRPPCSTPRTACSSAGRSAPSRPSSTSAPTCCSRSSRPSRPPTTPPGAPPSSTTSCPSVASLAKAYCSEAYFHAAAENIQIHGGIGFTWEHPAHLYFKRAKSSELLFGDPTYHRELLAQRIGI